MSEDSSNNNTTESINHYPPSMEAENFLSYLLNGNRNITRDYRNSPSNFLNSTNISHIPIIRPPPPIVIPSTIDTSENEIDDEIDNELADMIHDISRNTSSLLPNLNAEQDLYLRFLEDILQLPPLAGLGNNQQRSFRNLLRQTLTSDKNPIKQVLSEEGEKCITDVTYDPEIHTDIMCCPITMKEFKDGDTIAKLPCKHMFDKPAIFKWLKEEKAECPICRFKLKSIEKKEESDTETPLQPPPLPHGARLRRRAIPDNIRFSFGPPRVPSQGRSAHFRRLMQSRQEREEEEELQAALLASLEDQYMPNEKISNVESSSDSECELSSSDEMDQID